MVTFEKTGLSLAVIIALCSFATHLLLWQCLSFTRCSRLWAVSLFSSVSHSHERALNVEQQNRKMPEMGAAAQDEKRETARTARANEISVGFTTQKYDWLMRETLTAAVNNWNHWQVDDGWSTAGIFATFPENSEQSEALEALISSHDVIAILPLVLEKAWFFNCFVR